MLYQELWHPEVVNITRLVEKNNNFFLSKLCAPESTIEEYKYVRIAQQSLPSLTSEHNRASTREISISETLTAVNSSRRRLETLEANIDSPRNNRVYEPVQCQI